MNSERFFEDLLQASEGEFEPDASMLLEARRKLEPALEMVRRPSAAVNLVESSVGRLLVGVSERGIAMIHYLREKEDLAAALARLRPSFDPVPDKNSVAPVADELRRYLDGDTDALRSRVDLRVVTSPFQEAVLKRLCETGPGVILTYSSLGALAGAPQAQRAVGGAMHDNPIPIYVPCHRVIRSDGSIGGYGGGLAVKRKLLRVEGFSVTAAGMVVSEGAVWGNLSTRIYCRPGCDALARAKRTQTILYRDAEHAKAVRMRPCRVCNPQ